MKLPDPSLPWPIPMEGVALIAEFEGCELAAYRCPAGKWTIGWGETEGVGPNMRWTQEQADRRLCESISRRVEEVKAALMVTADANELAALVSFAYNCGGWRDSSVVRAHNRSDRQAAARAFALWNKARVNGVLVELPGLTRRRAAEAALYLKPAIATERMPQAVEPESRLTSSPIAQSGAVTLGSGVVALASAAEGQIGAVGKTLKEAKTVATETLGVPSDWFLPGVLIAAGAAAVWFRLKQRRGGWS